MSVHCHQDRMEEWQGLEEKLRILWKMAIQVNINLSVPGIIGHLHPGKEFSLKVNPQNLPEGTF